MTRLLIFYFIISLVFLSVESTADSVGDNSYGIDSVHLVDTDSSPSIDMGGNSGHCQHCCHGHASSISGHITAINLDNTGQRFSFYNVNITNFAQAPPTPPPNV